MTDTPDLSSPDRGWVSAWRDAVASSPCGAGLVDLASRKFLELSPTAAELLEVPLAAAKGLDYLQVAERPEEAAMTFHLARQGLLDAIESRRRFTRRDGSRVELHSHGRTIRSSSGQTLGLWVVAESEPEAEAAIVGSEPPEAPLPHRSDDVEVARLTVGIVGDRWRVTQMETSGTWWPEAHELVGTPVVELAHPHDVGVLLLTLAGATTAAEARARLRWRLGDTWLVMEMEVTLCEAGDGPTFGVVLEPGPFGPSLQSLVAALPAMSDLPVRQREVLVRLARGERVPQIAKEMYLSPKTVRNHLAAIFRKAGVHSQQQLLARLRHPRE